MKKTILAISLLLFMSVSSFAKKTEDMYVMRHTTQGQLFFITENIFNKSLKTPQKPWFFAIFMTIVLYIFRF